ncbi:MAG: D-aminoacyl-tRNA deacylase [Nitrososphaerales archaeon]
MIESMENLVIVSSNEDIASINIAKMLIEGFGFRETDEKFDGSPIFIKDNLKLIRIEKDLIFADYLNDHFLADAYIFISRHKSESKIPCLTTHFPGNFSDDNSHGGKPRELARTYPSFQKEYIKQLWKLRESAPKYQIILEPMHHGPTSLTKPVIFVEIGSTEQEWKDVKAGEIISKALMNTINVIQRYDKVGIGFGGTHYSEKFTKFLIESDFALGAIASKYSLQFIDGEILNQMIEKCPQKVNYAILDWKGLGKEKTRIVELIERANLKIIKI